MQVERPGQSVSAAEKRSQASFAEGDPRSGTEVLTGKHESQARSFLSLAAARSCPQLQAWEKLCASNARHPACLVSESTSFNVLCTKTLGRKKCQVGNDDNHTIHSG